MNNDTTLSGIRVLELTKGFSGAIAAKQFADYGAEVILLEDANGHPLRHIGPFPDNKKDLEFSGAFIYTSTNKKSIELDIFDKDDLQKVLSRLNEIDIFITDFSYSELREIGITPEKITKDYNHLIFTTITPFGLDGPYSKFNADELIVYAMSGLAYASPGVPDVVTDQENEPPLHPNTNIAESIAGIVTADATILALYERIVSGNGHHVDISIQEAVASFEQRDLTAWAYGELLIGRLPTSLARMPNYYIPCKDGYVAIAAPWDHQWEKLKIMMDNPDWANSEVFANVYDRTANWDALRALLINWTEQQTGDEIIKMADKHGLPFFAYYSIQDMLDSDHVKQRGSILNLSINKKTFSMPGPQMKLDKTPIQIKSFNPIKSNSSIEWFNKRNPLMLTNKKTIQSNLPLNGIRIADFGQVVALPFATQWLSRMGAEVILFETSKHMTTRVTAPFVNNEDHYNNSGHFNLLNEGKQSIQLDLEKKEAIAIAREIIKTSDVIVDNFKTGVMDKLGLSKNIIRELNPKIVQLSLGAFGRSGPMASHGGLHSAINLFSGVAELTGYGDGMPRILGAVMPDPLAGSYGVFAILASLIHVKVSNTGQYIDGSMFEPMLTLIPSAIIDTTLNHTKHHRIGNRHNRFSPHGFFPTKGYDRWIAISITSKDEWRKLKEIINNEEINSNKFSSETNRKDNEDALELVISNWTKTFNNIKLTDILQDKGIKSGPILQPDDLLSDPQLLHRKFIIETDHPTGGKVKHPGVPWRIDNLKSLPIPAPLLGEHTKSILSRILKLTDKQIEELEKKDIFN
ncbi:MAG: CoA transferase [Dehalococcoidia bacterium]|jgi:crotonobetainyl-CoA:carnitine CoA-transferase CaiB-like acyl-CoA transferase|nr:MAG: Crotonobetainyl-CoA:carnitine CoA-transferase CaiB [Chloroflexota bacterium]|tara:strand:- start:751 stop:3159 length:2409 start_codon:yes stop_codon:yes gene_type:complete